jgi:hypothetical protein
MKLDKLHVFERNSQMVDQGKGLSGGGIAIGGRLINFSASSGRQQNGFGLEEMKLSCGEIIGHDARTSSFIHDQGKKIVFRIEFRLMPQALIKKGVENDPSGMVCSIAGPLDRFLAIIPGMTTEVPLGDLPLGSATKRNAHMLELIDGSRRILDQDLNGILISQVVASLDRVIEIPFPAILLLITERSSDSSLGCSGMGSRRRNLAHDRHIRLAYALDRCPKSCQASSHNDHIMLEDHFDRSSMGI